MEVDVFNMKGNKTSTVNLPDEIFNAKVNVDLMHQAYVRQMANARLGTHSTKRRGEVSGGGPQALASEGHWACPPGFTPRRAGGRWWQNPHPQTARLLPAHAA